MIGHSNRSSETFLELLGEHRIQVPVDVRQYLGLGRFRDATQSALSINHGIAPCLALDISERQTIKSIFHLH